MDFRLILAEEAIADLQSVLGYIADDNPVAAERVGNALLDHIETLKSFPMRGASVRGAARVRKLIHTPYRIYYEVDSERGLVSVLHIWHGARKEPLFPNR